MVKMTPRTPIWPVGLLTLIPSAQASYAQMRLEGLNTLFALALIGFYTLLLDLALLRKAFRTRGLLAAALVLATGLTLGLILIYDEPGPYTPVLLGLTWAEWGVLGLVPFLFVAPIAQYSSLRRSTRSPRWILVVIALHILFPLGFWVNGALEQASWERELARLHALGRDVQPGGVAGLLESSELNRRWGRAEPELLEGIADSDLIRGERPLSPADRAALAGVVRREAEANLHYPRIEAKILWDELKRGEVGQLTGSKAGLLQILPAFLELVERYAPQRLCPDGGMLDNDRDALLGMLDAADSRLSANERQSWRERLARLCRS